MLAIKIELSGQVRLLIPLGLKWAATPNKNDSVPQETSDVYKLWGQKSYFFPREEKSYPLLVME